MSLYVISIFLALLAVERDAANSERFFRRCASAGLKGFFISNKIKRERERGKESQIKLICGLFAPKVARSDLETGNSESNYWSRIEFREIERLFAVSRYCC